MPSKSPYYKDLKLVKKRMDRYFRYIPNRPVNVKTPKNLTKNDIVSSITCPKKHLELYVDSIYYLTHCIITQTERKEYNSGKKSKSYVALKHKFLRDVIGSHFLKILKASIKAGIIERDGKYQAAKESIGYRLTKKYRLSYSRFVTLTHQGVVNRYNKVDYEMYKSQKVLLRKHAYLVKWLIDGGLTIDKYAALEYLRLYNTRVRRIFKSLSLKPREEKVLRRHLGNSYINSVNILVNWEKPKVSIDIKGGRLFSPLTSIMSQLRYFLSYKGEELVYFDIKNSQPFHLLALLTPEFYEDNTRELTLEKIHKDISQRITKKPTTQYTTTIMMLKHQQSKGLFIGKKGLLTKKGTAPRFVTLVVDGKLYKFISDSFMGKFKTKNGQDPFATDKLAKQEMIRMLYFNPKEYHSPSHKYFAEFQKLFPEVAQVISLFKSVRYQDFSIILQKVESTILLGHVCREIHKHNIEIPMYTIHDGIMTTKKHASFVESTIKSTYKTLIGVEPELSKEAINSVNAGANFNKYLDKKTRELFSELKKDFSNNLGGLTLEDISDILGSGLFKKTPPQLPPYLVTIQHPWEM